MKIYYKILAVALLAVTANNFVWFALTYWAYLTTKSVITTSFMAGTFLVLSVFSGFWFGSIVDHTKKKRAMMGSSIGTLILFLIGLGIFQSFPESMFATTSSIMLWVLIVTLLCGTLVGSIYSIAIPALIPRIVPKDRLDKANGMFGTVLGTSFAITSVASGISLAFGGMGFVLIVAIFATLLAIVVLAFIQIPENSNVPVNPDTTVEKSDKRVDIRGTIRTVRAVKGLFALILFTTLNNFLGGVFFALMDAYGLSLVSVQNWGILWGFLSLGFIAGGLYISRKGLGSNLLRLLFRNNLITWSVCILFTIQPSIVLLAIGSLVWMFLLPFTEAIEQTIFQRVVPPERLGRVFGFAYSLEQSASPVTAFFIGPITQLIFIPFMTTGRGAETIGSWFGTGTGRGIALVFIAAGTLGLLITILAMRSRAYLLLSEQLSKAEG